MKKYILSFCVIGAIVYSCKTQSAPATPPTPETPSTRVATSSDAVKQGQVLYAQRCARCHDLPAPSEFTASDWKPIMERMAPKAKLTAEETNWVLAYVNANAKK
ncbi:cytochrome c [Epilithonimonas sp.]|uniref:c-type cytochrome n=1 Tax=Epilithonimonas sp. TaxID=2894511 RepID=UPI0035B2D73B